MAQHKAETEDKGKIARRKPAVENASPQHQDGPFAANLDLGQLDTNTVGRLQRTIGNKATQRVIQRQYDLEEKTLGGGKASSPAPMPYPSAKPQAGQTSFKGADTGSSPFKMSAGAEGGKAPQASNPLPMPYPGAKVPASQTGFKGADTGSSPFKKSTGDEAGTLKGMISSLTVGSAKFPSMGVESKSQGTLESKLSSEQGGKFGGGAATLGGKTGDSELKEEG